MRSVPRCYKQDSRGSEFRPNIAPPPNASSKFYYNAALRSYALPIPEGQAAIAWEPSKPEI
jgi:hypothetical protein